MFGLTGNVSMPENFEKYSINVDFPAPMFPSTETLNGRSLGVLIFVSIFSGVIPTKLLFFTGVCLPGLAAGLTLPFSVVTNPSMIVFIFDLELRFLQLIHVIYQIVVVTCILMDVKVRTFDTFMQHN